ncbi:MAG: hypothetical protein CBB67_015755 [Alteromonadaceae bacterium TMED7]|nr:MAG: hypothetical protein CBB67_015755 [Alteromonadaceae bacterium TMED7]
MLYELERVLRSKFESPVSYPPNSIILASFPKSGNSWFRFVVSNVNAVHSGEEYANFQNIGIYAPEIRGNRKLEGAKIFQELPLFLKTHFPYNKYFEGVKAVSLTRNPFYVIPSYYEYLNNARGKKLSNLNDFFWHWRYGFNAWAKFTESWLETSITLKYEDFVAEPCSCFSSLYDKLGYRIPETVIHEAVEKSTRKDMAAVLKEKGDPHNINGFKFVKEKGENKGVINLKDEILSSKQCSYLFKDILMELGYD